MQRRMFLAGVGAVAGEIALTSGAMAGTAGGVLMSFTDIPGPGTPPILGNALQIGSVQPWLEFEEWANRFGSLVRFKVFDDDCLLVNDPELIAEVLWDQFERFHKTGQLLPLQPILTTSVFIANQSDWDVRRSQHPFERIDLQAFFAGVLAPMRAHARKRVAQLASAGEIQLHEEVEKLTFELFGVALLNDPLDDSWREEEFALTEIGSQRVRAPVLRPPSKGTLELRERWFGRLRQRIEARLLSPHRGSDLLDTMLRLGLPEDLEHFTTEFGTVFFGGVGAVSTTVTAMLRQLSLHPKVHEELALGMVELLSSAGPDYTLADLDRFDLLRRTVSETLRMEASVPFFLRVAATDNARVGPYAVPKGVKLFISPWVLQRTAKHWPDPLRFDPGRFERQPAPFTFIPFGAGPRECVGKIFAMFFTRALFATFFEQHRPEFDVSRPYRTEMAAGNYVPSVKVVGRFVPINLEEETPEGRIRGTNAYTNAFAHAVIADRKVARARSVYEVVLHPPETGVKTRYHCGLGMEVALQDYDDTGMSAKGRLLTNGSRFLLPMTDPNTRWRSSREAEDTLRAIFPGMLDRTVDWKDPTGDAAMIRLVTQGMGAHLLRRARGGGYEVDLQWMRNCDVRADFQPFGGRLQLSEQLAPVLIEREGETYRPADGGHWERAKMALRSSILAEATIVQHLVMCHFVVNNGCIVATRSTLTPDHPIRRLLVPFHYRGATINRDALAVNIGYQGSLQRIFGFTWPGLKAVYQHAKEHSLIESFPMDLARRGVEGLKGYFYGEDGLTFWNSAHAFVTRYFDAAGLGDDVVQRPEVVEWLAKWGKVSPVEVKARSRADIIDLCTHQIFNSTAFHEHGGGNLGDYVHDLEFMPAVLRKEHNYADTLPSINTSVQVYMLAVATNLDMPKLMDDWAFLLIEPALQQVARDWQGDLRTIIGEIELRNANREQTFPTFNPKFLKLSVSF